MPETAREDDPTSKPAAPPCPSCGQPMRLIAVGPDAHFINLNIHDYTCDCGKDTSFLIARKE